MVSVKFYFFFSSRRRHTRSLRDWSSDVCSSDLGVNPAVSNGGNRFETLPRLEVFAPEAAGDDRLGPGVENLLAGRSEERRVGKECRSGWWWYCLRKKENNDTVGWLITKLRKCKS